MRERYQAMEPGIASMFEALGRNRRQTADKAAYWQARTDQAVAASKAHAADAAKHSAEAAGITDKNTYLGKLRDPQSDIARGGGASYASTTLPILEAFQQHQKTGVWYEPSADAAMYEPSLEAATSPKYNADWQPPEGATSFPLDSVPLAAPSRLATESPLDPTTLNKLGNWFSALTLGSGTDKMDAHNVSQAMGEFQSQGVLDQAISALTGGNTQLASDLSQIRKPGEAIQRFKPSGAGGVVFNQTTGEVPDNPIVQALIGAQKALADSRESIVPANQALAEQRRSQIPANVALAEQRRAAADYYGKRSAVPSSDKLQSLSGSEMKYFNGPLLDKSGKVVTDDSGRVVIAFDTQKYERFLRFWDQHGGNQNQALADFVSQDRPSSSPQSPRAALTATSDPRFRDRLSAARANRTSLRTIVQEMHDAGLTDDEIKQVLRESGVPASPGPNGDRQ
jgi:hypothetical protein